MEQVYDPTQYGSSRNLNMCEYFTKYRHALHNVFKESENDENSMDVKEQIFSFMGLSLTEEQKKYLEGSCSINNLDVPGEQEIIDPKKLNFTKLLYLYKPYEITEEAKNLKTVQHLSERQKNATEEVKLKNHLCTFNINLDLPPYSEKNVEDMKYGEDILVYIRVFRPFKYVYGEKQKNKLLFDHEIVLLGSQTLADFRDKIRCRNDMTTSVEVSNNPNFGQEVETSKETFPSGFIFIDGIFYNDMRQSNAIDYSEVIRKWAKEKKIDISATKEMCETRLDSLSPRLGYPYVYQHQSCCEHIIMFSYAHLLNFGDSLRSRDYPYYSSVVKEKDIRCIVCGISAACWLVLNCDRIPHDKAPLCTDCFKSYNYINGKKVGNFKAYSFVNKNTLAK